MGSQPETRWAAPAHQAEQASANKGQNAVAVLGVGLMGSQIAFEYALGAYDVICVTHDRIEAERRVAVASGVAVVAGLCTRGDLEEIQARISYITRPKGPNERVWLVVESVVEDITVKARVLREAARAWPQAVLGTNTSSISVNELARALGRTPVITTHYWNPPLLMPPVEVCPSAGTPDSVTGAVIAALRRLGKEPIEVRKDVPGLVWNRLQFALLRECLWLLENDVVTVEEIDEIVCNGLARRLSLVGPLATVALGGHETFDAIAAKLFPVLSVATQPPSLKKYLGGSFEGREHLDALRLARDAGLIAELQLTRSRAAGETEK